MPELLLFVVGMIFSFLLVFLGARYAAKLVFNIVLWSLNSCRERGSTSAAVLYIWVLIQEERARTFYWTVFEWIFDPIDAIITFVRRPFEWFAKVLVELSMDLFPPRDPSEPKKKWSWLKLAWNIASFVSVLIALSPFALRAFEAGTYFFVEAQAIYAEATTPEPTFDYRTIERDRYYVRDAYAFEDDYGTEDTGLNEDQIDNDGDGYTALIDCDDNDHSVYPGAFEDSSTCDDGIDQDCDGADFSCDDIDEDGDGYSPNDGDCDDSDSLINPDELEYCDDGLDNNCNGEIDLNDADCH